MSLNPEPVIKGGKLQDKSRLQTLLKNLGVSYTEFDLRKWKRGESISNKSAGKRLNRNILQEALLPK